MSESSVLEKHYEEILKKVKSKSQLKVSEKGFINKYLRKKGEKICFYCYEHKKTSDFRKQMTKCIECCKEKHPLMSLKPSELYELVLKGELDHSTLHGTYKKEIVELLKTNSESHCFTCNRTKSLSEFTKIKSKTKCNLCKSEYDKYYHSIRNKGHDKRMLSKKDIVINSLSRRLSGHNRRAKELGLAYGAGKSEAIALFNHFGKENGELRCAYCNETNASIENFHIEHIIPLSLELKGNTGENITIACKRCNFTKRDLTFKEWISHIEKVSGREVTRKKFERLATYLKTHNVNLFDMDI